MLGRSQRPHVERVTTPDADAGLLWAASGAMALTGRADGSPLMSPGRPAAWINDQIRAVADLAMERTGQAAPLPDARVLAERSAIAGFSRRAPWSCGGTFRALRTRDGWLGLSLARPDDLASIPALVRRAGAPCSWETAETWASAQSTREALAQAHLLGLAAAGWPAPTVSREAVVVTGGGSRAQEERPLVVDLTSLWAGPLCAHLLALTGCTVVKVESSRRPDGARRGPAQFFDLLHGGHDSVAVDLRSTDDVRRLRGLVGRAALVLESSRSRALRQIGIDAEEVVADGTSWLSITAHGRTSPHVGFGDDVAMGAGLAIPDGGDLLPVGDAIADVLTGVAAAAAASAALAALRACLIDVSMDGVVRAVDPSAKCAARVVERHGEWWVENEAGAAPVARPQARRPVEAAAALGRDTAKWLR